MPRLESSALFRAGKVLKVLRRDLGADDLRILLHNGVGLIHGLAAQELSRIETIRSRLPTSVLVDDKV